MQMHKRGGEAHGVADPHKKKKKRNEKKLIDSYHLDRAFMGKIRRLPGAFGERIVERTELSEPPNLENVEIDTNRKMFLCAPHKVLLRPEARSYKIDLKRTQLCISSTAAWPELCRSVIETFFYILHR
jgi:hypothetical protein